MTDQQRAKGSAYRWSRVSSSFAPAISGSRIGYYRRKRTAFSLYLERYFPVRLEGMQLCNGTQFGGIPL